ncbi:MAG: hypothetical protein H0Z53_06365 [Nitrosospira sp.]|nr:hypothetical protein [Nitrosospira sp.]MBI0413551.1 hypothetical protein [Nitrosospira sp.]MSQ44879.1 hypothetical protein [Nitrosomonadaceae bacterium]
MADLLAQPIKTHGPLRTSIAWIVAVLIVVNMAGCNLLKSTTRPTASVPAPVSASAPTPVSSSATTPTPTPAPATAITSSVTDPCVALQREVERLQQLLAEKEALIRSQQIRQREPAKMSQEPIKASEVPATQPSRVRVEIRRLPAQ